MAVLTTATTESLIFDSQDLSYVPETIYFNYLVFGRPISSHKNDATFLYNIQFGVIYRSAESLANPFERSG